MTDDIKTIQRPNPTHIGFDDLEGVTIVKTANVNRPWDDDTLLAALDDQGRVWLSRNDSADQEDEAFIQLGLWTGGERDQFYKERKKAQEDRAKIQRDAQERATYERLRAKFEAK